MVVNGYSTLQHTIISVNDTRYILRQFTYDSANNFISLPSVTVRVTGNSIALSFIDILFMSGDPDRVSLAVLRQVWKIERYIRLDLEEASRLSKRSRRWKNLENVEAVDQFQEFHVGKRKIEKQKECVCVYVYAQVDPSAESPCLLWFRSYRAKRSSLSLSLSLSFTFSQSNGNGTVPIFAYRCSPSVHNLTEFANGCFLHKIGVPWYGWYGNVAILICWNTFDRVKESFIAVDNEL